MKLFSNQGYHSTSMQEIASDNNISKGTLYNYFDSKEELLVQVFTYNHEIMFQKVSSIYIDQNLAPKEKFKKMLTIEFEGILENKDYFNLIFKSLPRDKSREFSPLMQRIRAEMMDRHREIVLHVYGDVIQPLVWDLVISLQGIVKEFMNIKLQDDKDVSSESVADFVIFSLDAMVDHHAKPDPVLTNEMMKEYQEFLEKKETLPRDVQLKNWMIIIRSKIQDQKQGTIPSDELLSTVDFLEKELGEDKPRNFLVQALLGYLSDIDHLDQEISAIKNLLGLN